MYRSCCWKMLVRGRYVQLLLRDFQNAIGAPACIPQQEIAAMRSAAFGLALDALYAVDVRQAASSSKEVDVELPPAWVPKFVGNASLLHEPSLRSWRTTVQEILRPLGLVSRVVPDSGIVAVRAAIVEFASVVARKSPATVLAKLG
jgi:enoyl-CoA hydratase/carnithine racemase